MPRIDIKNKSFIDFIGEGITTSNAGAVATVSISGGTFIDLIDTPASYSGNNSKLVGVKSDGTGLEFVDSGSGSIAGNITFNGTITDLREGSFELISSADNITGTPASVIIEITSNSFDAGDWIRITGRPYSTYNLEPGVDFAIGSTTSETATNLANKINTMGIQATAGAVGPIVTVTTSYSGTWGNLFKVYKNDGIISNFSITGESFYDYGQEVYGWFFTGGTDGPPAYKFTTLNTINNDATRLFSVQNNDIEFFSIREGLGWNDTNRDNDDRTILTFNNKDGMEKLQLVMGPGANGSPGFYTTQGRSLFFTTNTDYAYQYPGYKSVEVGMWPWNPSYSIWIENAGVGNSEFELRSYAAWMYAEDQVSGDYGWVGAFTKNYNEAGRNDVRFVAEAIGNIGLTDNGVFFGGNQHSNPTRWAFESNAIDGGSNIAYDLGTKNAFTASGAKLLSLKNLTSEKFAIDKDGNLTLTGTVDGVDVSTLPALINAKMSNPMTASGDIIYGGTSGLPTRLAKSTDGKYLSLVSGLPSWVTLPSGVTTFLGLSDTPSSFSGQATKALRVNAGATALEFTDFPAGITTFLGLSDTPSSFSGQAKKYLKVNAAANAVEFVDVQVQQNSSPIVTQPTAYNFTGIGVTVTNNAGVAEINIPGVASGLVDWKESVLDKDLTTSPSSPNEGDRYIIAGTGGAWSTFTIGDMVTYLSGVWEKETPDEGFATWVEDEDNLYVYNGSTWIQFGSTIAHNNLTDLTADDHTQYLLINGTRAMSGGLNMGAYAITNVGNVDGRDVSVDGATLDTHLNGGNNKHDASEIDVEGTYANITGTPTDLESTISAINSVLAGSGTFIGLTDTPSVYTDQAGKIPRVKDSEDGLEFVVQPDGALGGYVEKFAWTAGSDTTTSATFNDITNITNQTFITPVSGPHTIFVNGMAFSASAASYWELGVVIDDQTAIGVNNNDKIETSEGYDSASGFIVVDLAAGEHTIRLQWRRTASAGTLTVDGNAKFNALIQAQGSGINGLEIVEDTMTGSNFTVTSVYSEVPGGNMTQVSDVQVTFNTLEGERVEVKWIGQAQMNGSHNIILGYQVDSDTPIECHYTYDTTTTSTRDISFNRFTDPLSAGQHTIKLMASKSVGSALIYADDAYNTVSARLQVIRYKSFGIGAGTIITDDILSANFVVPAPDTWYDTGLEITFDAIAGERVNIEGLSCTSVTSGSLLFQHRYELDGTTYSPIMYHNDSSTAQRKFLSLPWITPALTAGTHTIKLKIYEVAAGGQVTLRDGSLGGPSWIAAVQHRGGLIPIQDEGVTQVDKPSALNFTGTGVTVTQNGSVADIDIAAGGASDFTDLGDVPSAYTGQGGKVVAVKSSVDGLEFIDAPTGVKTRYATATNYTTNGEDIIGVTDTSADRTITIATADLQNGKELIVKDESGGCYTNGTTITVATEGSETIDGVSEIYITMDYGVLRLYSDGTNWFTV